MKPSRPLLAAAAFLTSASLGLAQFSVTSEHIVNVNGSAYPSTDVPLGTYAWTRTGSLEGLYNNPPAEGQPSIESFATTPIITPDYAATAMADLTVPDGFTGIAWATPPLVNHPTAVAAAPDGTIYVAVDGAGSLGGAGGLGRIVRLRDLDNDGDVDEAKPFVPNIDSPRGVVWHHDHLIVLAPPDITAHYDRDGDGIAEEKRTLVTGISFPLTMALADHSTQNVEVGIDGWIYFALGDIGMLRATGSDGRTVQMRAGGIVRFRPDGSGLEVFATNTRNNYGLAIGPQLDAFARDNTNDGGGWNVRLHHFTGMTNHGYPSHFINFPDEIVTPLADFGGGSGVGAMWLDEPGIPARWNDAPFTADWGQRAIFRHEITPKGATFSLTGFEVTANSVNGVPLLATAEADGPPRGNEPFLQTANPIDADVDGNSNIYFVSWRGGGFNWAGVMHGMVYRVSPNGFTPAPLPDWDRASAAELVSVIDGPSHVRRIEAQRAIVRRGASIGAQAAPLLQALAANRSRPLNNRVAALFTDRLLRGAAATPALEQLVRNDPTIAAWALRALGDDLALASSLPIEAVTAALSSPDPRTRKEALIALARADAQAAAPAMTALLGDTDPIVRHTAVQALGSLRAVDAALSVVDTRTAPRPTRTGALNVLQMIHEPRVTDALELRLRDDQSIEHRVDIVSTLARLAHTEAQWNGTWWATRPSTVGPYYAPAPWGETESVLTALNETLERAGPEETLAIGRAFVRQGVSAGAAVNKFLAIADTEPALVPQITSYFAGAEEIPANAIPVLTRAATTTTHPADVRVEAITALTRTAARDNWAAMLPAVSSLEQAAPAAGRGGGGRGGRGAIALPAAIPGSSPIQELLLGDIAASTSSQAAAVADARSALLEASFGTDAATITARAAALASAEQSLANAQADAFARVQDSVARFNATQIAPIAARQVAGTLATAGAGRGGAANTPANQARNAILNSPRLEEVYPVFIQEATRLNGDTSQLADAALLTLAGRRFGAEAPRQAAAQALDAGWNNPARRLQIILAAVTARDTSRADQIVAAANDSDAAVARAARFAMDQLEIDPAVLAATSVGPRVGTLPVAQVIDMVANTRGSVARGRQLVSELGCVACHTVSSAEAPKGPPLNLVSGIMNRRAMAEAILQPSNTIAQGFASTQITRRNGESVFGFVVEESPEVVNVRDITSQLTRIPAADIASRTRMDTSMMPEGLASEITVAELASLIDYIESLGQ